MENRAFEDEPSKSSPHQYLHQQLAQMHHHIQKNEYTTQQSPNHQIHHNQFIPIRFDPYRSMDLVHHQHNPDCHVYEDIVNPYGLALEPGGTAGGFQRNLTLPLRRTSQSCESLETNPQSSSVRVTNRERTRGSVIDRISRDDRNRDDSLGSNSSSVERPARRRRKKDCKHCKTKDSHQHHHHHHHHQQQRCDDLAAVYEERNAELRAIFGSRPPPPQCLGHAGVVYAIGCTSADCNGSLVSTDSTATTSTIPRFAHAQPDNGKHLPDDKGLVTKATSNSGSSNGNGSRAAGMKVNSIYAQDHWNAKDPRIFSISDSKDQNSPFQRAYSAVSATSPISENRANLRRSVRDEPAPHPARLRKHRHGWTLHFGRPLGATNCTKSLVLLLIVVLALLGIGGIALYIVFEPEKLHVIQQYLRSSARNATVDNKNGSLVPVTQIGGNGLQELEEPVFSTSQPTSSLLDSLLNATVSSINSNNVPGIDDNNNLDEQAIFVSTWSSASTSTSTTASTTQTPTTAESVASSSPSSKQPPSSSTTTRSATSRFLESARRRSCNECRGDEVCVARNADETPFCRTPLDPRERSGCGGHCDVLTQKCHKLDGGAHRCMEKEHHCLDDEWTCHNIFCIPLVKRCDGQMNCYDHSDEYNCECNLETHFHCGNQTSCLPLSKKCDGHVDCFDATDEENCTTSHELGRLCPSKDEFTCRNKQQCIRKSRFCDGYRDCKDGSDEPHGCQGRCNKHEFTCHNGRCINKADKCNGIDDCGDGSDEQHCRERL